jgi:FK506-binding nuclear protein
MTTNELEDNSMEDEEDNMSEMDENSIDLFWKGVVKPDEPLVASRVEDYFLRITNACLGPDAQDNTRTCLTIVQGADETSEPPGVICTLKNNYENHQLNLLVTDDVQLSVTGDNASTIYLVGYLSPAEQHLGDNLDLDDELEDMEDESELAEELKELGGKNKQAGRKRKLAEMENEESDVVDEEKVTSAQKKQKTASGKAKPQPQPPQPAKGKNENNKNPNQKNQNPNQKNPNPNPNPNQKNQNPNQKNQNPNQKNQNPNQKNQNPNQKNQNPNQKNPNQNKKQQQQNKPATESTEETTKVTETITLTVTETPAAATTAPAENNSAKSLEQPTGETPREFKNQQGVNYKDIRTGEGKVIKKGTKVRVFYVGQLQDKKVFDKVIDGDGKEISVGSKELVDGLDRGLIGMKAGGKRRIVVPAKLGYGDSTKDVPPNSQCTNTF